MASNLRGEEFITPLAVLCYSHLIEPDDKGKNRAELVIGQDLSEGDARKLEELERICKDLIARQWPGKTKGAGTGILSADDVSTDDEIHNTAAAILRPWTKPKNGKPGLTFKQVPNVRDNLSVDEAKALFYDGCIVRAAITPFTYDVDGNRGVSFFLNSLLFVGDGERIGGQSKAAAGFAEAEGIDMEEDAVESLL